MTLGRGYASCARAGARHGVRLQERGHRTGNGAADTGARRGHCGHWASPIRSNAGQHVGPVGGADGKIKLLQKTRNEPGMLLKTKDRFRKTMERNRNVIETQELN